MHRMIRALTIALVLLLPSGGAAAATRYVAKTGGCAHMKGLTCAPKKTCGATLATACCTVQQCIDSHKTSRGDTCEVHGGTYTESSAVVIDGQPGTYAVSVTKADLTIKEAANETATLEGSSEVRGCLVVGFTGNGLTVDGVDCHNYVCGTEDHRAGEILIWGASRVTVRNVTLTSAMPTGKGEFACGGVRIQSANADNIVIENNTLRGHMGHAVLVEGTSGSSGIVVRNNTIEEAGQAGSTDAARIFCVKSTATKAPIVFYGNRIASAVEPGKDGPMIFMREPQAGSHVYVFNNICVGCANGGYGAINTQDNVRPYSVQNADVFNNTITGTGQLVSWQNYFSALRVTNNLCDGCKHLVRGYESDISDGVSHAAAGDKLWSKMTDKLTYNVVERSSKSPYYPKNAAGPSGNLDVTGTEQSTGSLSSRDSANNLTAKLGVATNDPLGQGPGICLITAAGQTIDCSLDINGTDRGTAWDAGADQFAPAP